MIGPAPLFTLDPDFAAVLTPAERSLEGVLGLTGERLREREGRRTLRLRRAGRSFIVKQHFGVGFRLIAKHLLAGRLPVLSARNEWQALDAMAAAGINGPGVLGRGLAGANPARRRSFVVLEDLAGALSLEELAAGWRSAPPAPVIKRGLIRQVGTLSGRLHRCGLNHRDLNLSHFLIRPGATGLWLIDLHRAALRPRVPARWRVKDLGHLYYSCQALGLTRRDLLRFIEAYAGRPWRTVLAADARLWRRVAVKAAAIAAKDRRRAARRPPLPATA